MSRFIWAHDAMAACLLCKQKAEGSSPSGSTMVIALYRSSPGTVLTPPLPAKATHELGQLCRRRELAHHPVLKSGVCGFESHRRYYAAVLELGYKPASNSGVERREGSSPSCGTCLVGPVAKSFPFQGKDRGFEPRTRYYKRLPHCSFCATYLYPAMIEPLSYLASWWNGRHG